MNRVYIAVGSNLGDRPRNLRTARALVERLPNLLFLQASPIYETDPVGGPHDQEKYLNAVWELETAMTPEELLAKLLEIEKKNGAREERKKRAATD